jgi:glucose-6-phosphate 1-dehydrogenase
MQNHLLQILSLVAMEEPISLNADDIRDRKVELLKNVQAIVPEGVLTGQYAGGIYKGANVSGYADEPGVPDDSLTPTYAKIKLKINNDRWRNTPFVMTAGKGMLASKTEVRVKFKSMHGGIFCGLGKCPEPNELIIRIQPNEGFHFRIATKAPGGKMEFVEKDLDLSYHLAFNNHALPDAYENLLLDVMSGNKELFIRDDELSASWDILMPALNYLESEKIAPELYPFGSEGPESALGDN